MLSHRLVWSQSEITLLVWFCFLTADKNEPHQKLGKKMVSIKAEKTRSNNQPSTKNTKQHTRYVEITIDVTGLFNFCIYSVFPNLQIMSSFSSSYLQKHCPEPKTRSRIDSLSVLRPIHGQTSFSEKSNRARV